MASPRLERLCCALNSSARADPLALRDFQLRVWNGLGLGSAALGLLGVALLRAFCRRFHRRGNNSSSASYRPTHGRVATAGSLWAAAIASNCLGTAGILARSALWLAAPFTMASPLCVVILAWVQFWFISHFWAIFCYSLEAFLLLRNPANHRSLALYCLLCWGVPACQCLPDLLLLMYPAEEHCGSHQALAEVLEVVRYASTYVPLTLVFLGSPLLFSMALHAVPALLRRSKGVYTASERHQEEELRRRFTGILTAFAACWTANVLNELLLVVAVELKSLWSPETWHLLCVASLSCWTIMAILNPLSGLLLMLALSAWRSSSCTTGRAAWRALTDNLEDSPREQDPLPEAAPDPADGFLVGPGMLEVSCFLASLESSTSVDFICAVAENSSVQPRHRNVELQKEDASPAVASWEEERLLSCNCKG
ncbi:G-protein coupled receptor 143-like isoform X1 [Rhineura floridana]|uniref:G-protein coupled receptor 143-like isoform X1 n=1 Tax=Rhineura floridana TaxID=261503 RepID=UPI002AC8485D|nr:G-protein coupled receptor 143-like isoform X1 [Rhineura floridana]